MHIGGLTGSVTYQGELNEFVPLLQYCEQLEFTALEKEAAEELRQRFKEWGCERGKKDKKQSWKELSKYIKMIDKKTFSVS